MIKKSLLIPLVGSLLGGISVMIYAINVKISQKRLTRQHRETLASFPLFDLDSSRIYLHPKRATILLYFDSGCDHCQYEISEIISNRKAFENTEVVFMSSELISTIKSYAAGNCPPDLTNMRFTKINENQAYKTFGSLAVPQIFIYGADGALLKEFKGETKVEALIQYL